MGVILPHIDKRTGRSVMVEDDVLNIKRRIVEGCPIVGWRGDPDARLFHHPEMGFWVGCVDAMGEVYVAASNENCDETLLRKLRDGDWQHGRGAQLVVDSIKATTARQDAEDRAFAEAVTEEYAPRLITTLLKNS